jgi:hypothetical protein
MKVLSPISEINIKENPDEREYQKLSFLFIVLYFWGELLYSEWEVELEESNKDEKANEKIRNMISILWILNIGMGYFI